MPAAATHDRIALYAAGLLIPPAYLALHYGLGDPPTEAYSGALLLAGAHLFGSWWLSPDLDLDGKIDDRWGPLRPLWLPYMHAVPHRGFLSHSGFSGIFRLIYFYFVVVGVLALLSAAVYPFGINVNYHAPLTDWLWHSVRNETRIAWLIIVGVVVSDIVHITTDFLDTRRRQVLRWIVPWRRRSRSRRSRSKRR